MSEAFVIFTAGITGVFVGMALLVGSVKLTAVVVARWFPEKEAK